MRINNNPSTMDMNNLSYSPPTHFLRQKAFSCNQIGHCEKPYLLLRNRRGKYVYIPFILFHLSVSEDMDIRVSLILHS